MQLPLSLSKLPRPINAPGDIHQDDEAIVFNPSGAIGVGIPSAAGMKTALYLYNISVQTITLMPAAGTINGEPNLDLVGAGSALLMVPDGVSNWLVVGQSIEGSLADAIEEAGTAAAWGTITGTLANQTDLQSALDAKARVGTNSQQTIGATIATTGNSDVYITAPFAGSLSSAVITPLVALTANDTNYLTWTITNLGQAGAGTAAMLAATDPNTTKATGGTGLAINTPRLLTLNATPANLVVAVNDLLLIRAAATNTLANTVTRPLYKLSFTGS